MIIRKNMTPNDVQKQVDSMSKFKRGFNQMPKNISDNAFNKNNGPVNSGVDAGKDFNKKMQSLRNISRLGK